MCIKSYSESGQPCGFAPCEAYIKLLSEKSRLEGRCAGLENSVDRLKDSLAASDARMMRALDILEKADMLANHQIKDARDGTQ